VLLESAVLGLVLPMESEAAAAAVAKSVEPPRTVRRKQEGQVWLQQSYIVLVQVRVRRLRA